MNCLILGGGGFIGSNICEELIRAGHSVVIFEKEGLSRVNIEHLKGRIRWVEGDFLNPEHLKSAVEGVDIVYHLVSTTHAKTSNQNPVYDVSSNVVPTLHLFDAAVRSGVKKVIFASSGGTVYGIPKSLPIREDHTTDPICSYGIHKLTIEKYLGLYRKLHGLDYAVMRISNPYGERQRPTGAQGAVTVFLYRALRGEDLEIWGDGSVIRDYLHISDVARAAVKLIDTDVQDKIVNIGSGIGLTLNDIVRKIEKIIGRKVTAKYTAGRPFDVPANILDISRASECLGWKPEVDFEAGLLRTKKYMKDARFI